ncbi:hypothetical protein [Mollivirus kamchatka]|nr:hypothetical protein [Mollivirus kamchatka]
MKGLWCLLGDGPMDSIVGLLRLSDYVNLASSCRDHMARLYHEGSLARHMLPVLAGSGAGSEEAKALVKSAPWFLTHDERPELGMSARWKRALSIHKTSLVASLVASIVVEHVHGYADAHARGEEDDCWLLTLSQRLERQGLALTPDVVRRNALWQDDHNHDGNDDGDDNQSQQPSHWFYDGHKPIARLLRLAIDLSLPVALMNLAETLFVLTELRFSFPNDHASLSVDAAIASLKDIDDRFVLHRVVGTPRQVCLSFAPTLQASWTPLDSHRALSHREWVQADALQLGVVMPFLFNEVGRRSGQDAQEGHADAVAFDSPNQSSWRVASKILIDLISRPEGEEQGTMVMEFVASWVARRLMACRVRQSCPADEAMDGWLQLLSRFAFLQQWTTRPGRVSLLPPLGVPGSATSAYIELMRDVCRYFAQIPLQETSRDNMDGTDLLSLLVDPPNVEDISAKLGDAGMSRSYWDRLLPTASGPLLAAHLVACIDLCMPITCQVLDDCVPPSNTADLALVCQGASVIGELRSLQRHEDAFCRRTGRNMHYDRYGMFLLKAFRCLRDNFVHGSKDIAAGLRCLSPGAARHALSKDIAGFETANVISTCFLSDYAEACSVLDNIELAAKSLAKVCGEPSKADGIVQMLASARNVLRP